MWEYAICNTVHTGLETNTVSWPLEAASFEGSMTVHPLTNIQHSWAYIGI